MSDSNVFDYIVIGSGAGGGPVAANLARAGQTVLVLEAGEDHGDSWNYRVPAFHPHATEDPAMRWDYFVRHFTHQPERDSKFSRVPSGAEGIYYPRAATLGGCTAHNAMITIAPYNRDWEDLQRLTGDPSWHPDQMRKWFQNIERHRASTKPLSARLNSSQRGFAGWLPTEFPDALEGSFQFDDLVVNAAAQCFADDLLPLNPVDVFAQFFGKNVLALAEFLMNYGRDRRRAIIDAVNDAFDPNDWDTLQSQRPGLFKIPMATDRGERRSTRDRLKATEKEFPNLVIRTGAYVMRLVIEPSNAGPRVTGVAYVVGARRADRSAPAAAPANGDPIVVRATKEVIVAAGTFNTPQLLMLSGIGPRSHLESLGVACLVDLPGVGQNLLDRYEVSINSEIVAGASSPSALPLATAGIGSPSDCRFRPPRDGEAPDACLEAWEKSRTGLYTTNGAVVGIIRKSKPERPCPDLFLMGLLSNFRGYFPGYAEELKPAFTWTILKAYTNNKGGTVRLRDANPFTPPEINFRYFEEGTDNGEDMASVVEGVRFARRINARLGEAGIKLTETWPASHFADDEDFVRREAWGHHACGTCRIGERQADGVLDSQLRVHGVSNLRVVDASVFPRIPGFFIAMPILMVAEKVSHDILRTT